MTSDAYAPRYREIEQALRSRIAAMRPGQRLPSDSDLCQEFGVSRMTARHAMQRLAEEGLVLRDPGRGTFVAEPPAHRRANALMTFSREMRRRGHAPTSRLLVREVCPATTDEAADLRLAAGMPVVRLRRVRIADGRPIALESAVMPERCAGAVMAADLEVGSLHAALIRGGMVPTRGQATISAEAATVDDSAFLEVAVGDPLLVERRIILDQRGRPLERTESRYAASRYALDVGFSVEDRPAPHGRRET